MRKFVVAGVLGTAIAGILSACGGDGGYGGYNNGPPPAPTLDSYVGTTGVFVAWADDASATFSAATVGSYAGKKQSLRGTIDFISGRPLGQPAGVEIYKGSDGFIHEVDLTSTSAPVAQQVSSETAATIDDTCTLSGTAVAGANYDYVGVYFTADLVTPTNSSYMYRLPGPDGVCNTADDVIHMVKTGMSPADAPIVATGMPVATVRTAQGGISGFVVKNGASLVLVDGNFANPIVLGTFAAPIGVAVALPVGTTQGYPSGQLYVVDGNIVYVDYVGHTVSSSLFAIPNWTPTNAKALFAASPNSLYFSINTPAAGATPASTAIYSMPANGSAPPAMIDSEAGTIATLLFPVAGANLLWGVENPTYTIRTLPASGAAPTTLVTGAGNDGTFIATAATVYYESWTQTNDTTTHVLTRSGTQSGIVGVDGTVIQAPLANSTFVDGGEQQPWPDDTVTTITPYQTLFQVTGLTPVTVTNATTGYQYVEDGVSGGTLVAIDARSNQPGVTVGTLPTSTAVTLSGTFRDSDRSGFLEASNALSTEDPATRDLYLLNSQEAESLTRVTDSL
ncbi:MAG: hypothetical protein ABSD02_06005 [Steroidobacteraceae bacterium]|jgi:hypothetical protein